METISGLSLSSTNYQRAIELLRERFGNNQVLISSHMEALVTLPKVTNITDIVRLRQI